MHDGAYVVVFILGDIAAGVAHHFGTDILDTLALATPLDEQCGALLGVGHIHNALRNGCTPPRAVDGRFGVAHSRAVGRRDVILMSACGFLLCGGELNVLVGPALLPERPLDVGKVLGVPHKAHDGTLWICLLSPQ